MNRPPSPTRVMPPPPAVPGCIVTCSRIWLLRPITSSVSSPRYLQILRPMAEAGEGEDAAARAERGPAGDHDMGLEPDTTIQPDAGADHAVGADRDVIGQLGPRVDDRGRMDLRHRLRHP